MSDPTQHSSNPYSAPGVSEPTTPGTPHAWESSAPLVPPGQPSAPQTHPGQPYPTQPYPGQPNSTLQSGQQPAYPSYGISAPYLPPGTPQFPTPGQSYPPGGQAYPAPNQFGGYGSAPWQGMTPGIVALRPLQFGDILSGAVSLIRFNPKATLGLSLIVHLVVAATAGLGIAWWLPQLRGLDTTADVNAGAAATAIVPFAATTLLQLLASVLLGIILPFVTIEAVVGRKVSIGQAWHATKSRILPSIGYQVLLGVATLILLALLAAYPIYLGVKGNTAGTLTTAMFGMLAFGLVMAFFTTRLAFVTSSIVLERASIRGAIARSWRLTAGQFWRIFAISLVASIIASVLQQAITFPITLLAGGAASVGGDSAAGFTSLLFPLIGAEIAQVISVPFTVAITVLLYIDQRIRKEGFDIALLQSAEAPTKTAPLATR